MDTLDEIHDANIQTWSTKKAVGCNIGWGIEMEKKKKS